MTAVVTKHVLWGVPEVTYMFFNFFSLTSWTLFKRVLCFFLVFRSRKLTPERQQIDNM